jgi:hypothetical protein
VRGLNIEAIGFSNMDPVVALALAGNVVQFVDIGAKLVNTGVQLYRNKQLLHHADLREKADDLLELSSDMRKQLETLQKGSASGDSEFDGSGRQSESITGLNAAKLAGMLSRAVTRCSTCAADVSAATKKLVVQGQHPVWESFRIAISTVLGESGLRELSGRLADAEKDLYLFLVLFIRFRTPLSSGNSANRLHQF